MNAMARVPAARPLFRFAVVSDTHVSAVDGGGAVAFPSGRLANARAAAAVAQISAHSPDFVIHLGDMVHPVPGQDDFFDAARRFREIFSPLPGPLHLLPGNHDVGDKPMDYMPSRQINDEALSFYRRAFGEDRTSFDRGDCRFVLLNAPLINSGLEEEDAQWRWLEGVLSGHKRIFLFLHYPPFLHSPDEADHYDNISEPGRGRLLRLILGAGVEAVFSGHVHNIFLNRLGRTEFHTLPATSFVRQDFQEIFSAPPPDEEFGRNDLARFGFHVVDVYEDTHTVHWIQTFGAAHSGGATVRPELPLLHPRGISAPLGVDVRSGFADAKTVAITGVVNEFSRKKVRNDYLPARLCALGLRELRVPLTDLDDPATAARIRDLTGFGHRFTLFGFGLPESSVVNRIARYADSIAQLELVFHPGALDVRLADLARLRSSLGLPLFASVLRIPERSVGGGQHYTRVHHGFRADEAEAAFARIAASGIDGLSFRIERDEPLWPARDRIDTAARHVGKRAILQIRLSGAKASDNPSDPNDIACIVADAALVGAVSAGRILPFLDTLVDQDYGYMPRKGLIDRRFEPNPAAGVLARLSAVFAAAAPEDIRVEENIRFFQLSGVDHALLLPCRDAKPVMPPALSGWSVLDLGTGGRTVAAGIEAGGMPLLLARTHETPDGSREEER